MAVLARRLSAIIHGDSKVGKSWLGDTAPAPRLCLDAEGGVDWTPSRKIEWNPISERPPVYDGTWDTCVVRVHSYQTVEMARQWLASGQHPFKSVIVDSISEVQQRCIDAIAGTDQMKTQDWGELLRKMSSLVREFRDYTLHPTNPLQAVILIAMSKVTAAGKWVPSAQGQLGNNLPYYFDLIGYLFIQDIPPESQVEGGPTKLRRLLCAPHAQFEAGERLGGRLPEVVDSPNITAMLDVIYGPEATASITQETQETVH
jgi:hypothetical protein